MGAYRSINEWAGGRCRSNRVWSRVGAWRRWLSLWMGLGVLLVPHPTLALPGQGARAAALQAAGLTAPAPPSSSSPPGVEGAVRAAGRKVDVNQASAAELEQVRGIGPALALRIVKTREASGRFRDADDLRQRVRGIGAANLHRMQAAGLVISGAVRIEPARAAQRHAVELVVGNRPGKSDRPGAGRVDEMPCCDTQRSWPARALTSASLDDHETATPRLRKR